MPGKLTDDSQVAEHALGDVRYRRASLFFAASLLLLASVAAYLLAAQRKQIWTAAHQNALSIALGLEASISSLLQQPSFSLQGIRADLARGSLEPREKAIASLRDAMRFDPVSEYLGLGRADVGEITVVDHRGDPVQLTTSFRAAMVGASGPGFALRPLVRLSDGKGWYLPLTLRIGPGDSQDAAFALVPVRRLISGAESLRLLPDSWVSLVTLDGTRLLGFSGADRLQVNGARMPPELLKLAGAKSDVGDLIEPITGRKSVVGYSRSETVPLFVGTVVPFSSLYVMWLKQAVAPLTVLVIALFAVGVFGLQLRTSLRRQQLYVAEQEYLASHDTLTGLLNRDAFIRLLERVVNKGAAHAFAVVLLDLNHFKDINDTLGHAAGDRVLEVLGERLTVLQRAENVRVGRLGGDELAIFAPRADFPQALERFCARVQACLNETIVLSGVELNLSASMGATLFPHDAKTPAELLRCADIAMYSAKSELRSYSRYTELMDNFTADMLALKSEFARALRDGGLSIVYQPKVRLSSGALVGLEALSRWKHPTLGAMLPARYVQLAETTELIHPFTLFMLESAMRQVARWLTVGRAVPVSVNISANNLLDHTFVDKLAGVLDSANVPAEMLELEITESAVMRHPETMLKRLHAVRELGVQLSIDDFGTGYASLAYLKTLPVHALKIDKSFVIDLADDEADQRIVRSSIQLAHGFGMTVVAEGVESEAVVERLQEYRCDFAQGFHYAAPSPADVIEDHWLGSAPVL
jgi:diguanylate cyclase (GGDEF)-like protein